MKNAYNQGLECDHGDDEGGDDDVSPKDVGHNIYILAHQVSLFFNLCIVLLILSVSSYVIHGLLSILSRSGPSIYSVLVSLALSQEKKKLPECP